jgi:hypothetical protein
MIKFLARYGQNVFYGQRDAPFTPIHVISITAVPGNSNLFIWKIKFPLPPFSKGGEVGEIFLDMPPAI